MGLLLKKTAFVYKFKFKPHVHNFLHKLWIVLSSKLSTNYKNDKNTLIHSITLCLFIKKHQFPQNKSTLIRINLNFKI